MEAKVTITTSFNMISLLIKEALPPVKVIILIIYNLIGQTANNFKWIIKKSN
ncbi:MAG: hypothetical protein IJ122_04575 [Methanobrevibacter sp.]|nr:hypothetical protein [Methanobrevibacter sp.]